MELKTSAPDHYATLGLDRRCTITQVRAAYRLLVKNHHPDLHPDAAEALQRSQELNAAHTVLSDPAQRRAYDRELDAEQSATRPTTRARIERNITQDVKVRIEDLFRGVSLGVRVDDPASFGVAETYELIVPPMSAPGARFRLPRVEPFEGGFVQLRLRVLPSGCFKLRGSDLRTDLRISATLAANGGTESIAGPTGTMLRVTIPRGAKRGEIVRISGEGLPRARGGRGDLLVRISYRLEARISRLR